MKTIMLVLSIVGVLFWMTSSSQVEAGSGWSDDYISTLSSKDCKGIASGQKSYCKSKQCKATASGERSYCP
jgi:hypothetical protein